MELFEELHLGEESGNLKVMSVAVEDRPHDHDDHDHDDHDQDDHENSRTPVPFGYLLGGLVGFAVVLFGAFWFCKIIKTKGSGGGKNLLSAEAGIELK